MKQIRMWAVPWNDPAPSAKLTAILPVQDGVCALFDSREWARQHTNAEPIRVAVTINRVPKQKKKK